MLGAKVTSDSGAPKKLLPKWDQLVDDCLTQEDFYDELLFPREDFLIAPGVGYPNERAMLSSMNTLQKALRRNGKEEWKIFPQEDGSRIVRLVKMEREAKGAGSSTARKVTSKMTPSKESRTKVDSELTECKKRPRGAKDSPALEPSVGKGTSPRANESSNPRSKTTAVNRKGTHRPKNELRRSESLPQLRAEWERREIRNKYEAEKRFRECGDFEPYSREELQKMSEEKKRYLELKEQHEDKSTVVEVIERSSSVGDVSDSDDSSARSFRTRIIRYSKTETKGNPSGMSSTEGIFITSDDVIKLATSSGKTEHDNREQVTGNKLGRELDKNVVFDVNENGIVCAADCTEEISNEGENKKATEVGYVVSKVENVMLTKPWKMGKQMWASMTNRDTSRRTQVGILDREQWNRDVSTRGSVTSQRLLKEGYCLKTQNETCDRLSVPKYGLYAMKNVDLTHKKPIQAQETLTVTGNTNNRSVMNKSVEATNRKSLQPTEAGNTNEVNKIQDQNQGLKTKHEQRMSRTDLKNKSSGNIPSTQKKIKKSISTTDVSDGFSCHRKSNRVTPSLPYEARQLGVVDVTSRTDKKRPRLPPPRPEFNTRTLQGLHDGPRLFSTARSVEVRSPAARAHNTRAMPPMAECSIVSSSAVNRRREMRSIDNENRRITARLTRIKSGPRPTQKATLSVRGTRREQLPFARIQNRALTK